MRVRVGDKIAECVVRDPRDCAVTVRFFVDGEMEPRWERRFEVDSSPSDGFEQPAIGVDRFRVDGEELELAYYRYCGGPGGREPSQIVRMPLDGRPPDEPITKDLPRRTDRTINEVSEAPSWVVLRFGEVTSSAVQFFIDRGQMACVAQLLNATDDRLLWQLAASQGAAPSDFAEVDRDQWVYVPAGRDTVALWVLSEPLSIQRWVDLLPRELGPVRKCLPRLLKRMEPGDAMVRPLTNVGWYDALAYCDRLSAVHGFRSGGEVVEQTFESRNGVYDAWDAAATEPIDYDVYARQIDGYRLPTIAEWSVLRGLAGRCDDCTGYGINVADQGDVRVCLTCSGQGCHNAASVASDKTPPSLSVLGHANEFGIFDGVGNVLEWSVHAGESEQRRVLGATWAPAMFALPLTDDPRVGFRPVRTAPMNRPPQPGPAS
jgi:hypothetical protein